MSGLMLLMERRQVTAGENHPDQQQRQQHRAPGPQPSQPHQGQRQPDPQKRPGGNLQTPEHRQFEMPGEDQPLPGPFDVFPAIPPRPGDFQVARDIRLPAQVTFGALQGGRGRRIFAGLQPRRPQVVKQRTIAYAGIRQLLIGQGGAPPVIRIGRRRGLCIGLLPDENPFRHGGARRAGGQEQQQHADFTILPDDHKSPKIRSNSRQSRRKSSPAIPPDAPGAPL